MLIVAMFVRHLDKQNRLKTNYLQLIIGGKIQKFPRFVHAEEQKLEFRQQAITAILNTWLFSKSFPPYTFPLLPD